MNLLYNVPKECIYGQAIMGIWSLEFQEQQRLSEANKTPLRHNRQLDAGVDPIFLNGKD